jgi:hypothetical protein
MKITILFIAFLYLSIDIWADNNMPKEEIGNKKIPYNELEPFGHEKLRLKYRYFFNIGMADALYKISVLSFGYNINGFFSIGISQNFNRQYYRDFSSYDSFSKINKGIYVMENNTTAQEYSGRLSIPQMGTNLFLHYYPLIKENIPVYIPFYLGRSAHSSVIMYSENAVYNPAYQNNRPNEQNPILYMSADSLPTTYYGLGIGMKAVVGGVTFGFEFGWVQMQNPKWHYNIRPSLYNHSQMNLSEFYVLQEQIKFAYQPNDQIKLNYGFLIGIGF